MVGNYRAFAFSSIGASHIKSNKVCQDSSIAVENERYRLIAVCDGHGGADYFRSDKGSRFAVQALCDCINNPDVLPALALSPSVKLQNDRIRQLVKSVIARWTALIEADIEANPFDVDEMTEISAKARDLYESGQRLQSAYGTTLIGAVITAEFMLILQIGDGSCCVMKENGQLSNPVPTDDNCFLNVTTSICDANSLSEFRWYFTPYKPLAVCIASDGIDDCFAGEAPLQKFYSVVLRSFANSDSDCASDQLREYLPVMSARGSGDDMSVALIIDKARLADYNFDCIDNSSDDKEVM